MFKKSTPTYPPAGQAESPYMRAQQVWDDRIGNARTQAANWRYFGLGALLIAGMSVAGLIYQSSKSSVTPYVVRVNDTTGEIEAIGPARVSNYVPQDAEIQHFLAKWIEKVRSVPTDQVLAKRWWIEAYNFVTPTGAQELNEYAKKENPLARVGQEATSIDITNVVAMTKDTYQVRWTENTYGSDGTIKGSQKMTGLFTITIVPPTNSKRLLINPLGIYIQSFSWSHDV